MDNADGGLDAHCPSDPHHIPGLPASFYPRCRYVWTEGMKLTRTQSLFCESLPSPSPARASSRIFPMEFTGGAEVRPISGRLKDWLSFSQSYLSHRPVQAPKIVKGDLSTVFSTPSVDISLRLLRTADVLRSSAQYQLGG